MSPETITQYLTSTLPNIESQTVNGDSFFFIGAGRKLPFATIITSDAHDHASDLNRLGVFRLNIGVPKQTYTAHFGPPPTGPLGQAVFATPQDFTALDQLLPHPVYAQMFWVCILSPTRETFEKVVAPLLAEAHTLAAARAR